MLNKNICIALMVLLVTSSVTNAASYDDTSFYVGGEISIINRTSYNSGAALDSFKASSSSGKLVIQKNEPGVNIVLGGRFNEYFSAEVGFSFIDKASGNVQGGGQASNKISNLFLDVLGYLTIAPLVDLVGSVGVGELRSKAAVADTTVDVNSLVKNKAGVRVGGGLQYYFADSWAARAMIRYQQGDKNFLKSDWSFSVGVLYTLSFA